MLKPLALALTVLALPSPAAAQDALTGQDAQADLTALYDGLRSAHYDLFESTPETVFDRHYAALMERFETPISEGELHAELTRFIALAGHGHARLEGLNPDWPAHAADGLVFPLKVTIHEGEVIVEAAPEGSPARPGDRILALNGLPNPIWLERLTRNISAETPALAYTLLAGWLPLNIWLEFGAPDHFDLTIERNGRREDVRVEAVSLDVWRAATAPDPGFSLEGREARLIEPGTAYLRPGPFYNTEAATPEEAYTQEAVARFTAFIDDSFESFIAADAHTLVLDLRDNPGGDASFSDPVVAWFADEPFSFASEFRLRISPQTTASNQRRIDAGAPADSASGRLAALFAGAEDGETVTLDLPMIEPRPGAQFEGAVLILINRHSYSNAVSTAALIQDYGFGTLIGEASVDMATALGAMETFTLPHTGWTVGYPKALIIRPNGREDLHPLSPDIALDLPAVRGARDVALEAALARARR